MAQYDPQVQHALLQTKTNRVELKKALDYFYQTGDPLKIKAINFLIANMPIHKSENYYWASNKGQRIDYNELQYSDFEHAVTAFDDLKKKAGPLHPVAYSYADIDSIHSPELIENIELAVAQYRLRGAAKTVSEDEFLEYILPYRSSIEPLQNWRKNYERQFSGLFPLQEPVDKTVEQVKQSCNAHFSNRWGVEERNEPLPRLGALQILFRKKGLCEDMAGMVTFMARSQGVAAAVDYVPAWGTSSGRHFLNYLLPDSTRPIHFDAALKKLEREPAKVLRTTYSVQKTALATRLDTAYIPKGFLRTKNYTDVTAEYWPVDDVVTPLFPIRQQPKVVYAAVLNNGGWVPVWYGEIKDGVATFKGMGKGVVYLPMYYINNTLIPAGCPFALGYNNKQILQPDKTLTHTITLPEQEKYLIYQPGKRYRLLYWNNGWKPIAEKTAAPNSTQLSFDNVPKNALLLLLPEYTRQKERPFIILEDGSRVWW
jgi:hypothetical protein